MRTWTVGTISEARRGPVCIDAQESRFNGRIEYVSTQRPLDTAELLRLFYGQPQTRHFQVLAADTYEHGGVRHDGQAALKRRSSRSSCIQSSMS